MRNVVGPVTTDRYTGAEVRFGPPLICLVRAIDARWWLDRLAPPTVGRHDDVVDHALRFARATVIREVGP